MGKILTCWNSFNEITGGLEEGNSIILTGIPGSGKTLFCLTLINHLIQNDQSVIYITLKEGYDALKNKIERFGWKIEGKVKIIDAFSYSETGKVIEKEEIVEIANPTDLNDLTIKIFKAISELKEKNLKLIVIDPITILFVYLPQDLILRFLLHLIRKFKTEKLLSIIVHEKGMTSDEILTKIESITDGTLMLLEFDKEKELLIERFEKMGWIYIDKYSLVVGFMK